MKTYFRNKPVIICIGTPQVCGDSLGPRVGDLLVEKYNVDAYVYGRSAHPVNGVNFNRYVEHVKTHHPHSLIIAVDACLGEKKDVGRIKYTVKGLRAGAALNKDLASVGDIGILGVIAEKSGNNLLSLMNADERTVSLTAEKAAEKIFAVLSSLRLNYISRSTIIRA